MKNKPLTLLTPEELLKLLEQEDDTSTTESPKSEEITEYDNNVVPFLSHYNLVPGDKPLSKKLLYQLYKAHVEDPLNNLQFQKIVGKFLDYYDNINGSFYKVNIDQFKVAKFIFEMRDKKRVKKDRSNTYRRHFENFLQEKEISAGQHWLEGYIIYEIYLEYCRDRKKRPTFSYVNFHGMLKVYFKNQRKTQNRSLWFQVNDKAKTYFTERQIDEFREKRKHDR